MSKENVISDIKNMLEGKNNEGFVFDPESEFTTVDFDFFATLIDRHGATAVTEAKQEMIKNGAMEIADGGPDARFIITKTKL